MRNKTLGFDHLAGNNIWPELINIVFFTFIFTVTILPKACNTEFLCRSDKSFSIFILIIIIWFESTVKNEYRENVFYLVSQCWKSGETYVKHRCLIQKIFSRDKMLVSTTDFGVLYWPQTNCRIFHWLRELSVRKEFRPD